MAKLSFSQYEALKQKGLNDDQIKAIAQKRGYDMPSENILASAAKTLLVKPADRVAEAVGRTGIFGEKIKRGYEEMSRDGEGRVFNTPFGETKVEAQKSFAQGGGRQIAADTLDSASYLIPVGKVASAATNVTGRALASAVGANALSGYSADVAANIREGKEGGDMFTPGAATAFSAALPIAGKAFGALGKPAKKLGKFMTSHLTGLDPETIVTTIKNPTALTKAQREGLSRHTVAENLSRVFKERKAALSFTGKEYEKLRKGGGAVVVPEGTVQKVLNKYGLNIDDSGRIIKTKESAPVSRGDIAALEDFFAVYGKETELSPNAFLNTRKSLDILSNWDASKTDISDLISKDLRKTYDNLGKQSIPGLKDIDEKYAPEVKFLQKVRKYLFDKDGNLLDTGVNRIANSVGVGKEEILTRLEKLSPGIGQQLQLVKALEDIGKVHKVGTYLRAGAVGASAVSGNVPLLVASFIVGNPVTSVPILKAYGRVNGIAGDVIDALVKKVMNGQTLKPGELMLFRKAIEHHLANLQSDKFDDDVGDSNTEEVPPNAVPIAAEDDAPEGAGDVRRINGQLYLIPKNGIGNNQKTE